MYEQNNQYGYDQQPQNGLENTLYGKQMNSQSRYNQQLPNLQMNQYGPPMASREYNMYHPDMLSSNQSTPINLESNMYGIDMHNRYAPTNTEGFVSQGSYGGLPPYEYMRKDIQQNTHQNQYNPNTYQLPRDNRYYSVDNVNVVGKESIPIIPNYPSTTVNAPPLAQYPIQPEYTSIVPAPYLVSDGPPRDQIFRPPYCSKCKVKMDTYKNSFNPSRISSLDKDSVANRTFVNNPNYRYMMTNANYIDPPNTLAKGYASADYFAPNAYVPCRKRCLY
jgi:hypothetical protein